MTTLRLILLGAAALCALSACKSDSSGNVDGRIRDGSVSGTCAGGVDPTVDVASAEDLAAGTETDGYVCPLADKDFYRITIPNGDKLLRVRLRATGAVSNVKLNYLILDPQNQTVASSPVSSDRNPSFDALHCLEPGTYFIQVQDEGNDGRDGNNPYRLSYTTEADPDTNEDNNDFESAVAGNASSAGAISCVQDADFFSIDMQNDQLLEVRLTTQSETPVELKYSVYDSNREILAQNAIAQGTRQAANLVGVHALRGAGRYFVKIEDDGGDESDPSVPYALSLAPRAEQDVQDQGQRNDTVVNATIVGNFSGSPLSRTFTGQVGSAADVDYYRIDGLSTTSPDNPAVIEVVMSYSGSSEVDPAVGLLYGDPNSPCSKDACCQVLNANGPQCTGWTGCWDSSFNCITKGESFCSDPDCAPNAALSCATERKCAGAAICLPGAQRFCAAEQNTFNTQSGATLRASAPLYHAGPWYLRVGDFQNNDYQYGANYTLTVRVRQDPDGAREMDNRYTPTFPPTEADNEALSLEHRRRADRRPALGWANTVGSSFTVSGHISYRRDEDWFAVPRPCDQCVLLATWRSTGSDCPTGTGNNGLEFVYEMFTPRHSDTPSLSFPRDPTPGGSGSFGAPNDCLLLNRNEFGSAQNLYLRVTDLGNNSYSWSCGYEMTLTYVSNDCPPCQNDGGRCYF